MVCGARAQNLLDAYVKIIDNVRAGESAIYRFTVQIQGASSIQTYLPSELSLPARQTDVCRYYLFETTERIQSCTYDPQLHMVQFNTDSSFSGFIVYDIGTLVNPAYSTLLTGFAIQTLDARGVVLASSMDFAVYVQISPNSLSGQSLAVGSYQIAVQTTYLFTVVLRNPVEQAGYIKVLFPTTQIAVPSEDSGVSAEFRSGAGAWKRAPIFQTTSTALTFAISDALAAGSTAQLRLQNVNNPNTMAETESFQMQTLTPQFKVIDTVSTGLTVDCSEPAVISITQISVSRKNVGAISSLTFKLTLPTKYSLGGYIIVTLPPTLQVEQNLFQCILLIGFNSDQGSCSLKTPKQIKLYDQINQQQLVFSINGVQNPPNTMPTDNFKIEAYDPQNFKIAESMSEPYYGFTPVPGSITGAQSIRTINVVGQGTALTLQFSSQNKLTTGEVIQIRIPTTHFQSPQAITCLSMTSSQYSLSQQACALTPATDEFTIVYSVVCRDSICNGGTRFTLEVSTGLTNVGWIYTSLTDSITITTMTASMQYVVDQVSSNVFTKPVLVEGTLRDVSLAKQEGVVGDTTQVRVGLTLQNQILAGGYLVLEVQNETFQKPLDQLTCQTLTGQAFTCSYQLYQASDYISTITLKGLCSNGCAADSPLSFKVFDLRNPKSVKPIQNQFTLRSYTKTNYAIDKTVFTQATGLDVAPALLFSVELRQPTPSDQIMTGALQTYVIAAQPRNSIEADVGELRITLPAETGLVSTSQCSAWDEETLASLTCQRSSGSNQFVITHSQTGKTFSGRTILITITKVKNPPSTAVSSYGSAVSYLKSNGVYYKVDQIQETIRVRPNTPNQIAAVKVERSITLVNKLTALQFCITPNNPYPAKSLLSIYVPKATAEFGSTFSIEGVDLVSFSGQNLKIETPQMDVSSQFCFTLLGDIRNPDTTMPSMESITITVETAKGDQIEQKLANIFAEPYLSAGPFSSIHIQATRSVVGQSTDLIFSVELGASLPRSGFFVILFPTSLFYTTQNETPQCNLEVSNTCDEVLTGTDLYGNYLKSIKIAAVRDYNEDASVTFTLTNVLNKYDVGPPDSSQIVVQSQDQGYTINSSPFELTLAYEPNRQGWMTVSRTNTVVQSATAIDIDFRLLTQLIVGSKLVIMVPCFWFVAPQNVRVSIDSDSYSTQVSTGADFYEVQISAPQTAANTQYQLQITGFSNRHSVDSSDDYISVESHSKNGFQVDVIKPTVFSNMLQPGTISVTGVSVDNQDVGAPTVLSISFKLQGNVASGDILTVRNLRETFYQVDYQNIKLNGKFVLFEGLPVQNTYWQGFSFTYPSDLSQKIFSVQVEGLQNLKRAEPLNLLFDLMVQSPTGGQVFAGKTPIDNLNLLSSVSFSSVALIRDSSVIQTNTKLDISFTLDSVPILASSRLQVYIPKQDLIIAGSCQTTTGQSCSLSQQDDDSTIMIDIANICARGCYAGEFVQVTIKKGLQNPEKAEYSTSSSRLVLTNEDYQIASISDGVTVEPSLQTADLKLTKLTLKEHGDITGQKNLIELTFAIDRDDIPIETLLVTFPDGFLIYQQSQQPSCTLSRVSLPCSVDKTSLYRLGQPTFALKLSVTGVRGRILANKDLTLKIDNLVNTDKQSDRNTQKSLSLTIVSETNIILASQIVTTNARLQIAQIPQPSFTRASTQTGEVRVDYLLEFQASNFIREDAYILVRVPLEQAVVEKRSLRCFETGKDLNVGCKTITSDSADYSLIEIKQWCQHITPDKSPLCPPTSQLRITLQLTNPNSLQTTGLQSTVSVKLQNSDTLSESVGFYAIPALDGIKLINSYLQRKQNILGHKDESLVVFVGQLSSPVFANTNLEITLPDGLIFQQKLTKPLCVRIVNSLEVQFTCNVTLSYPNTTSIKQIQIKDFCTAGQSCPSNSPLEVKIKNLVNPTTNNVYSTNDVVFSLRQENREIAFTSIPLSLPMMSPATSDIQTKTGTTCQTLSECALNVTLTLQNPLKLGDYINFDSPLDLMSTKCSVFNELPLSCFINSNNRLQLVANRAVTASSVKFKIEQTLMPVSTQKVSSFKATSYELIGGRATAMEQFSGGQVTVTASAFKNVTMRRLNTNVNETSDIRVFVKTRQQARGDYLQIQIPTQVAFLKNDYTACEKHGEPLNCQVTSQTVIVPEFDSWCENPDLGCYVLIKNARNPEFELYGAAQAVNVGLYLHGQTEDYAVHKSQLSVVPALQSTELQVSGAAYSPAKPATGQELVFSFVFKTSIAVGQFMIIDFQRDNKLFVPLLSTVQEVKVEVDDQPAEIIEIQTEYQQRGLGRVTYKLPAELKKDRQYSVVLTGITSLNVWLKAYDSSIVTVYQMKTSIQEVASQIINVPIKMKPASIQPVMAYPESPFVGELTTLVISFKLNLSSERDLIVELAIPDTYQSFYNTTCNDLQTRKEIACFAQNYTLQLNLTEAALQRPQNGFTLQIKQIRNPLKEGWRSFGLTAMDQNKLVFAEGSFDLETSVRVPCPADLDSTCSQCTNTHKCVQCGASYVLQGTRCQVICDEGMFELNGICFKCPADCLYCQRQDMCSRCQPDKFLIAGQCMDNCPKQTILNHETNACEPTNLPPIDCESDASTEFFEERERASDELCQVPIQNDCTNRNCLRCSFSPTYCEMCQMGLVRVNGECVSMCPRGHFAFEGECFKCSPACQDCEINANKCTSCRGNLLLADGYGVCVNECPTGTFTNEQHPSLCAQCHDSCNSCHETSTNCTSCFRDFQTQEDLYHSDGKCLQRCPFGSSKDLTTHECILPEHSSLAWALPLAFIALLFVTISTNVSHRISGSRSLRAQVASGLLNLIDFINRVALMCVLWPTPEMACFVLTGFYVIGVQVVGIYESKIIQLGEQRSQRMSLLSSLVGAYNTRLILGNFLGRYGRLPKTSEQLWAEFEECCSVQTWLTLLQAVVSIIVFTRFGLDQVQFGLSVNSLIFCVVQLLLQWVIRRQGKKRLLRVKLK